MSNAYLVVYIDLEQMITLLKMVLTFVFKHKTVRESISHSMTFLWSS